MLGYCQRLRLHQSHSIIMYHLYHIYIRNRYTLPMPCHQQWPRLTKTTFLANGLNGIYNKEWNELYIGIVTYVKVMYIEIINRMNDEE